MGGGQGRESKGWERGTYTLPTFYFGTPLISPKLIDLKSGTTSANDAWLMRMTNVYVME